MRRSLLPQPSMPPHIKPLLLSVMLTAMPGLAAAQFKCVDKAGNITLTDLACPGRNARGTHGSERDTPAGTTENMQQASRNNSSAVPRGNVPAKPQPMDAANEKPPARKPASAV